MIQEMAFDSRRIRPNKGCCFIALPGVIRDGHNYISHAISNGALSFICDENYQNPTQHKIPFLQVKNTLLAYQKVASYHRKSFDIPLLGITGSNGKTILKEWLSGALEKKYSLLKTPKSYNSQIGVPYTLLTLGQHHSMAVIETGISKKGDMDSLESMIKPSSVLFTNIGEAHARGFSSISEKVAEKLRLAKEASTIYYCRDHSDIHEGISQFVTTQQVKHWGKHEDAMFRVMEDGSDENTIVLHSKILATPVSFTIPFSNVGLVENVLHLCVYLLDNGFTESEINQYISGLSLPKNRLEKFEGRANTTIINDSYSSDLAGFQIALDYLSEQAKRKTKIVITNGLSNEQNNQELLRLIAHHQVDQVYWIGTLPEEASPIYTSSATVSLFLSSIHISAFENAAILIKGAHHVKLGSISEFFQFRTHTASLEVNVKAIGNNLHYFKSKLDSSTKIMATIKAGAYGSGSYEIAHYLESKGVDYLAVAYLDEAIELKEKGIFTPIIVFNYYHSLNWETLVDNDIEIVVFSFEQLTALQSQSEGKDQKISVHIEFDTGMRRLGFQYSDVPLLIEKLSKIPQLVVKGVFSHLAASEDPKKESFTRGQAQAFQRIKAAFLEAGFIEVLFHLLNSNGIQSFPEYQHDMVRLGIGLYGVGISTKSDIEQAHTLRANIIQIKKVQKGDAIGYGSDVIMAADGQIGIVNIGYADGVPRNAGRAWHVIVNGRKAPIVGKVCMDLLMIDLSDLDSVFVGDDVFIFSPENDLDSLAEMTQTIPYVILSNISTRIRRVYLEK